MERQMNKFQETYSALVAHHDKLVKAHSNDPRMHTPEGKLDVVISQLDMLTHAVLVTIKELGDRVG